MKNLKLLSIVLLTALFSQSCIVDDEVDSGFTEGPRAVGFLSPFESVAYFEDLGAVRREFPVSLIGGADGTTSASPITVNYAVDPSSTATEGVEFNFVDTSTVVTIPANGTFVQIPIDVNTASLNPTMKTTLRLVLTSTNEAGTTVSTLNETFDIIFVGCQSTIGDFSYQVTATRDDGAQWNQGTETFTLTDINTFKTVTTGGWGAGTIAPDQGYNLIDICGDITVPLQGLAQGFYSNEVTGLTNDGTDGEVLANGDVRIVYEIGFGSGDRVYTNYYTKL